jgi:hypothetical protein
MMIIHNTGILAGSRAAKSTRRPVVLEAGSADNEEKRIKPSGHHPGQACEIRRVLEGGKEGLSPLGRSNWPSPPQVEPRDGVT